MSIAIKIYQSKMINEVLTASSFGEIKNSINAIINTLKSNNLPEDDIQMFVDTTLKELKSLNQSSLPYDHYANIITAQLHLKELQLQMFSVIN